MLGVPSQVLAAGWIPFALSSVVRSLVALLYAIIHSQNTCDISTLETYYFNLIASQLNAQKWL